MMRRFRPYTFSLLVLSSTFVLLVDARPALAQGNAGKVSGRFEGVVDFTSEPVSLPAGIVADDLEGTASAVYFNWVTLPSGTMTAVGLHTLRVTSSKLNAVGVIFTMDDIVLNPTPFPGVLTSSSRLRIIGGTRDFDGATGMLKIVGGAATLAPDGRSAFLKVEFAGEVHLK